MKTKILKMLDDSIYEIFRECQNEMGIKSGDIEPLDDYELMKKMNELAKMINNILNKQK